MADDDSPGKSPGLNDTPLLKSMRPSYSMDADDDLDEEIEDGF
jgi:hypothetical protein